MTRNTTRELHFGTLTSSTTKGSWTGGEGGEDFLEPRHHHRVITQRSSTEISESHDSASLSVRVKSPDFAAAIGRLDGWRCGNLRFARIPHTGHA